MKISFAGPATLAVLAALASSATPVAALTAGAPCDVATATASIALGQSIEGRLDRSDCTRSDGSHADFYRLVVRTATTVQVVLRSSDFDAYLVVLDGAGSTVASDDDAAGGTDARIVRRLEPGTYYVGANTLRRGETGAYSLQLGSGTSAGASSAEGSSCAVGSARVAVAPGQRVRGTLDGSDCVMADDSYGEYVRLEIPSAMRVTVTLRSTDFDAYLALVRSNDERLATDDDGAGGTDARVTRTLAPGTYYVLVNTLDEGETGAFTLEVTAAAAESPATGSCAPARIEVGSTVEGRLSDGDCTQSDDSMADLYQLVVPAQQEFTIELRSVAFDAYLVVRDAAGDQVDSDDDGAGGTDSRLRITLPAGTYTIVANSLSESGRGAYTLTVRR